MKKIKKIKKMGGWRREEDEGNEESRKGEENKRDDENEINIK